MKLLIIAFMIGCSVAGCATRPVKETLLVEVPSPKPYRFIKWSVGDTDETKRAVRAHNRAHQAVIDAGKAAK